jgi:hypothetical protein
MDIKIVKNNNIKNVYEGMSDNTPYDVMSFDSMGDYIILNNNHNLITIKKDDAVFIKTDNRFCLSNEKLSMEAVLLILATKSGMGMVNEIYRLYWSKHFDVVPIHVLGTITKFILYSCNQMQDAIIYLDINFSTITVEYGRDNFSYSEMMWFAFKEWCYNLPTEKLRQFTNLDLDEIISEFRVMENKITNKIKEKEKTNNGKFNQKTKKKNICC